MYRKAFLFFLFSLGSVCAHKESADTYSTTSDTDIDYVDSNQNEVIAKDAAIADAKKNTKIGYKYRKRIIGFVVFVVVFLVLRYAPLQELFIFPATRFTDEEKEGIKKLRISDLSDESLAKKPSKWGCHYFVIHEDGKPDIQGYIFASPFNRLENRQSSSKKAILRFRGNAEYLPGKSLISQYTYFLHDYDVIEMDYPGKGASHGRIRSEQDLVIFAQRCYDYVVGQGYNEIILEGTSLGTFSASRMAADNCNDPRIKMLIMDAGFAALHYIQGRWLAPLLWLILRYRLDNIKNLAKVTCPIFIRHGTKDLLVRYVNGEWLHDSVKNIKKVDFLTHQGKHYPNSGKESRDRYNYLRKIIASNGLGIK